MFDHDEDKDLESQVSKNQVKDNDDSRSERKETPGPESHEASSKQESSGKGETVAVEEPSSTIFEKTAPPTTNSLPTVKAIPESAIPEKLITPPVGGDKH